MRRTIGFAALTGLILVFVMVVGTVWASAQPAPRAPGPGAAKRPPAHDGPGELNDRTWAARTVKGAPEIKKIQQLYARDPGMGQQAAADALRSGDPVVRGYAALVLGAIGTDEHLAPLSERLQDDDVTVRAEAERAHLCIRVRLAGSHEEKLASVLGPAFKSEHASVRLWAARTLAASPSERARGLMQQVLSFEKDPAVRAALGGK